MNHTSSLQQFIAPGAGFIGFRHLYYYFHLLGMGSKGLKCFLIWPSSQITFHDGITSRMILAIYLAFLPCSTVCCLLTAHATISAAWTPGTYFISTEETCLINCQGLRLPVLSALSTSAFHLFSNGCLKYSLRSKKYRMESR